MASCHKCGRTEGGLAEAGVWLERVNPVGEMPALWECRPNCQGGLSQDEALLGAITGEAPERGLVGGGRCARTACETGTPAEWFNNSTLRWYCTPCAHAINEVDGELLCCQEEELRLEW